MGFFKRVLTRMIWHHRKSRTIDQICRGRRTDITWDQAVLGYFILAHHEHGNGKWNAWRIYSSGSDDELSWDRLELIWDEAKSGRWSARDAASVPRINIWNLWLLRPFESDGPEVKFVLVELSDEMLPIPGTYAMRSAILTADTELVRFHKRLLAGPAMLLDLTILDGYKRRS